MTKVANLVIVFTVLMSCSYCSSKKNGKDENIVYYEDLEKVENIKFGDKNYFDTCFLVKLETNSETLIADIAQLEIFDNQIYIWDQSGEKLLSFDLQGNFKGAIGNKGRAPHEYTALAGFYINRYDSTINLFDPLSMSVKTYNRTGEYIKSVEHDNSDLCFAAKSVLLDSSTLFCYQGSNWKHKRGNRYNILETAVERS